MESYMEELPCFLLCQISELHYICLEAELLPKPEHKAY